VLGVTIPRGPKKGPRNVRTSDHEQRIEVLQVQLAEEKARRVEAELRTADEKVARLEEKVRRVEAELRTADEKVARLEEKLRTLEAKAQVAKLENTRPKSIEKLGA
jgi:chromosome segregation ATPase